MSQRRWPGGSCGSTRASSSPTETYPGFYSPSAQRPRQKRSRATWKSRQRSHSAFHSWESLRAVYQVLHEEMQEELDSRPALFFIENPSRVHMVRGAFPIEARLLREKAHTQEGPGTIPEGKMQMVVKNIAPGLRLRLRLPPGMSDDEDHSRQMWERCTGK